MGMDRPAYRAAAVRRNWSESVIRKTSVTDKTTDEGDDKAKAELAALRARCERIYAHSTVGSLRNIGQILADMVTMVGHLDRAVRQFEEQTYDQIRESVGLGADDYEPLVSSASALHDA